MPVCMHAFMPMCVLACLCLQACVHLYIYIVCVCVCAHMHACMEITGFLVSGFLNSFTDWLFIGLDCYRNYTVSAASSGVFGCVF